ncbi:PIR Superfamily Protein [Plasmodium ovale curtisi]|uniref:PIR Superfamily Protein n=1 Tax=Plasmodium ovale curtisi TaxID=864141 RepID=A0A1A8XF18_PLAOA|nr:PIR Superfamily Protein [Plasmodium ovale curtisi]SBT02472.1 PIR Superfamily Protein [Plasmodium ovale curtisi]
MKKDISENDLPSVKYDKEIKDRIQYSKLQDYITSNPRETEVSEWIAQFKKVMEEYIMELNTKLLDNKDKRCRDFQYLIFDIKQIILSLKKDEIGKGHMWKQQIVDFHNNYITGFPFKCNEIHIIDKYDMKMLDDFCEDSAFIRVNLNDIKNSIHCKNILKHISSRKVNLTNIRKIHERKKKFTKFGDNCSTEFLDNIFPSLVCTPNVEAIVDSGERLRILSPSPVNDLQDGGQRSPLMSGKSETNGDFSSTTIGLVSLPIFGVFACSFFLYKYTPLRPMLQSYFQNKWNVPIIQDDNSTEHILSNISNSNDIYSENIQYNVSYQTLQR